jgi:hypothetical protein
MKSKNLDNMSNAERERYLDRFAQDEPPHVTECIECGADVTDKGGLCRACRDYGWEG